ncbi:DUF3899 domain-containing protein [Oceanobacillus massiliensis]|uniref:DUF3899 domain-containing protein n=1 Tax=Oceanobacillus massiliensis TaxID=1465765 RepID=UPI00301669C2
MKLLKNKWFLLLLNWILTIILFFALTSAYSLVNYINIVFYVCMIYVLLGLLALTIMGGFFDGITFGFRRFFGMMSKDDYMDEWKNKPLPSQKINGSIYAHLKFQGFSLLVYLLVLLFVFYFI